MDHTVLPATNTNTPCLHYLVSVHQMAPFNHRLRWRTSNCSLLLIYRPREDERLSWPGWLTCSGRFIHIVVTRRLQAERRTGSVRRPKTDVLPTVLRWYCVRTAKATCYYDYVLLNVCVMNDSKRTLKLPEVQLRWDKAYSDAYYYYTGRH